MIEMKVNLVLVARRFNVKLGYEAVDHVKTKKWHHKGLWGTRPPGRASAAADELPCYAEIVGASTSAIEVDMTWALEI